ncbi:MAG: hypothetical protein QG673_1683 [Pseudomonadota bacterium]|nr:hypothetical protein [Pseudomonadota bacterium]
MSEQEISIVNNIANKLEFILYKDKLTVLALSRLLKIDKQLLYRIIKREHIPNMSFLEVIANYLNCTVIELIDKKFFLDVNVFNNNSNIQEKYRIYFYDENFMHLTDNEFFGIIEDKVIKIFYKIDKISNDGHYLLLEDDNKLKEINIISVGTNLIIALVNNEEIRLSPNKVLVSARLYKTLSIIQSEEYAVKN